MGRASYISSRISHRCSAKLLLGERERERESTKKLMFSFKRVRHVSLYFLLFLLSVFNNIILHIHYPLCVSFQCLWKKKSLYCVVYCEISTEHYILCVCAILFKRRFCIACILYLVNVRVVPYIIIIINTSVRISLKNERNALLSFSHKIEK